MLKLDFSLFEQTSHLGFVRTWYGFVCTVLDVPDILWGVSEKSNQPHFICSLFEQPPHGSILNYI